MLPSNSSKYIVLSSNELSDELLCDDELDKLEDNDDEERSDELEDELLEYPREELLELDEL